VAPPEDSASPGVDEAPENEATLTYDPVEETRRVRAREVAAGIPDLRGYALVVAEGPLKGSYWELPDGAHEAGRNTQATVFLDDVTVSRHHAAFRVAGRLLVVEDLGSTNGTYVGGKRIDESRLHPGDEVIIGRFHLIVARGA
jgi:hypothetical protein